LRLRVLKKLSQLSSVRSGSDSLGKTLSGPIVDVTNGNGNARTYGFYGLGTALTATEVTNYSTIITTFLTSIGRI
jgi:hypothetical protein